MSKSTTTSLRLAICSVTITGLLAISMPTAWAVSGPSIEVSVLQGTVLEKQATSSDWSPAHQTVPAVGTWLQTEPDSAAVVSFPEQVRFRLGAGTRMQVSSVEAGKIECRVETGRVFVSITGDTTVTLDGPTSAVKARSGSFVMDLSGPTAKLRVLDGNAQLSGRQVSFPRLIALPSIASLTVPAGFEAVASEIVPEAEMKSATEPLQVAANEPPQSNPGQSPGSTNYNPGGQYGDFSTSAGQDEVKQDANNVVPWEPTTTTTGTGGGGSSPMLLLGGLGGLGLLALLIGGSGGGGDNSVPPGPYIAPPPGL